MTRSVLAEIDRYRPDTPLDEACTPRPRGTSTRASSSSNSTPRSRRPGSTPAALDQVREPGQFVTFELAGEPLLVVCGSDGVVRGFFIRRIRAQTARR